MIHVFLTPNRICITIPLRGRGGYLAKSDKKTGGKTEPMDNFKTQETT